MELSASTTLNPRKNSATVKKPSKILLNYENESPEWLLTTSNHESPVYVLRCPNFKDIE